MATPDLLAEATSLHAEAVAALGRYQPDVASALLDRVDAVLITHREAALADPRAPALDGVQQLRTRALLARGWAAYDRSGPDAAEAIIRAATDLARQIGRPDLIALCHMQQASVRGRAGDLAGALELMDRAELGADALPAADLARLLANRGVLAAQLMRLTQAEADLARAADVAHDARTPEIEFMSRHNLGYVFYLRGDLPRALALMDSADAMPAEVNRAVSRLDRARVLLEAGLLDEARAGLDEARRLAEADGVQALIGEIELDLARTCLLVGDAAGARELARSARARFRGRSASTWRRRAFLAEVEAGGRAGAPPERTARLAAALGRSARLHADDHVARRAALVAAHSWVDVGDLVAAAAAVAEAGPLLRSASLPTRLHLRLVRARVAAATRPGAATRHLEAAAADLAAVQQHASSIDLRTALAVHSEGLATLDLDLGVASGSVAALFARAERWRAVSQRVPLVRPPRDPRAAELSTRLRRVREDLRGAALKAQPALRAEASALEVQVRALDWASPGSGSAALNRPLSYANTLAVVRENGATLASFLPHSGDLYAVVVTPRGGRTVRIGPLAQIGPLVMRVRADVEASTLPMGERMRAAVERSLDEGLGELDTALLAPLAPVGRRSAERPRAPERLVVVPSRVIAAVPFGMLPSRLGRPTAVARTATAWARAASRPPTAAARVMAIAGPDLEHADAEVRAIGAMWAGTVVQSADATRAAVVAGLVGKDLIHIAAHGQHHYQSPLFSTLRLADGAAFAHELPDAGVSASHVVLSACEVGRATIRAGDESLGLSAVLLSMGVQTVVAAVSRIPDDVAAAAMTAYHRRLATGIDSATALAEATADLPRIARAFTCLGADWQAEPARPAP